MAYPKYGGYLLKLGDGDSTQRFGGIVRPSNPRDLVPAPGDQGYVTRLQQDLITLGFLNTGESQPGTYDLVLEWAVREFQIAASSPGKGAAELIDRTYVGAISAAKLKRHALVGAEIYPVASGITGVADSATATAIAAWKTGYLRRPIVFQSYVVKRQGKPAKLSFTLADEGFWLATSPPTPKVRIFACDFTGDFDALPAGTKLPPNPPAGARFFPVGRINQFSLKKSKISGPCSTINDSLVVNYGATSRAIAGLSPNRLIGKKWQDLSSSQQSTYRVVRSVGQAECGGVFDSINAWDGKWVSAGIYHLGAFTRIKSPPGHVTKGELAAFFSYLRSQSANAFDALLQSRGLSVVETWGAPEIYNSDQAKYEAQFSLQGDDGDFAAIATADDAQFLRNWPWFYRLQMGFRAVDTLGLLWWPYARQRLADILSTPWPSGPSTPVPGEGSGVKIGDVFRSEATVAALLRWHVLKPSHIVKGGKAGAAVVDAFKGSGIKSKLPLAKYTTDEEAKLFDGLSDKADSLGSKDLNLYLQGISPPATPTTSPSVPVDLLDPGMKPLALSIERGFQFFADGIPFPRTVVT